MKRFLTFALACFPLMCFGAPSISYTSYFNNTHTYTNSTTAGTNSASRGVFTNGITAGASTFTGDVLVTGTEVVGSHAITGTIKMRSSDNGSGDSAVLIRSDSASSSSQNIRLQVPNDGASHMGFYFHGTNASAVVVKQDAASGDGLVAIRNAGMQAGTDSLGETTMSQNGDPFEVINKKGIITLAPVAGLVQIRTAATTVTPPTSGAGLELFYDADDATQGVTGRAGITAYDRGASAFKDFRLNAASIALQSSSSTKVFMDSAGLVGIGTASPTSTLHTAGSRGHSIATGSAFTLTATNEVYLCNVDAQTVTLPTAVGILGRTYTIKAIAPCTTGTVATTSSQLIDGATTYGLSASNKFVRVISDNARWWIIGNN